MTKATQTVAVIIPFYNGSRWIERALSSIFRQTVPADEVIVVNDGSCAEERAALQYITARYAAVRIIDKANGGQGSARNAGAAACSAAYLCFLDQDDFFLPDHVEVLLQALPVSEPDLGFVYGDCMEADGEGNIVRTSMVKEHAVHPKHSITDMLRHDMFILPSASIIDRKAYQAVGGFDEQFTGYEDDDLFMRLILKGYAHRFIDRPVYVWCIHAQSTSYSILMSRSRARYFRKLQDAFPDEPAHDRYYFADCLAPRFGHAMVLDAIRAAQDRSADRREINGFLRDYAKDVKRNPHVGSRHKMEIAIFATLTSIVPSRLVAILRVAARMPLIRSLVVNK